jgi:hypothetical protein
MRLGALAVAYVTTPRPLGEMERGRVNLGEASAVPAPALAAADALLARRRAYFASEFSWEHKGPSHMATVICAAVALSLVVALNIAESVAQRRRRARWLERRSKDVAEHGESEETTDTVKQIVAGELGLPANLLRDEDTIAQLCDLGMELADLRKAIRKRFGLRLRDRDFFRDSRWRETIDDDYSLTLVALERLIAGRKVTATKSRMTEKSRKTKAKD